MSRRTDALHILAVIACASLLQGCSSSGDGEFVDVMLAKTSAPLDCPADRIATVTDLHTADGECAAASASVGSNLKSHHYRVACEALQGVRPPRVEAVEASACREDERGAWTDVRICCPAASSTAIAHAASMTGGLARPRRLRLGIESPAVGETGTASVSLLPPPRLTAFHIRIAPESCDAYQLHPSGDCEADGSYGPGETTTFMVRYTSGSMNRRGGDLTIDYTDPALRDVAVRLSGGVGDGVSDWLSVPSESQ